MAEKVLRETRKQALRKQSAEYRKVIETQLRDGYSEVQRMGRLIWIGGVVGVSIYTLISLLGDRKPRKKKKDDEVLKGQIPVRESSVSGLIKEKIALFLLSMALERLKTHLLKEKPENDTTHPPETLPAEEDRN